jgi:hypothetical protein
LRFGIGCNFDDALPGLSCGGVDEAGAADCDGAGGDAGEQDVGCDKGELLGTLFEDWAGLIVGGELDSGVGVELDAGEGVGVGSFVGDGDVDGVVGGALAAPKC